MEVGRVADADDAGRQHVVITGNGPKVSDPAPVRGTRTLREDLPKSPKPGSRS